MLEITLLRQQPDFVKERLAVKNVENVSQIVDRILELDGERRRLQQVKDEVLNRSNSLAKEVGLLMKQNRRDEAEALKAQTGTMKADIARYESEFAQVEQQLEETLVQLPNIPHQSVPLGKLATDNVEVKAWGDIPTLHEAALPHWELAKKHQLVDFELGAKITGSGFPVFMGKGARLQRALIAFFLDRATEAGYTEYLPPHLVNRESAYATGQLPDKEGQMYHVTADNFYLIPTGEVPLTNIYRDVILREDELPLKLTGYTPCFRREAGAAGKDTRGLNRVHQFDKVEIVQIQHPDRSYEALNEMMAHVEGILQALELPYRILRLCGGDMTFGSALTYDFEVFSAAQGQWLEVSSVSNFETFQANRLKLRFRDAETKKTRLAHTLNGSAMALARIVAALLENHQTEDGIRIPEGLQAYTGFAAI